MEEEVAAIEANLSERRKEMKISKKARRVAREKGRIELEPSAFKELEEELKHESLGQQYFYRELAQIIKEEVKW